MRFYSTVIVVLLLLIVACDNSSAESSNSKISSTSELMKTYSIDDTFDNALFNLKEALKDKGFVINTVSHISKMLQRTGKDLGSAKKIYARAENIEFCSATLSRLTMEASPHNIVYCPYIISIYSLAKNPKKTYVSYRKLPRVKDKKSDQALQKVEKLLDELAQATVQ